MNKFIASHIEFRLHHGYIFVFTFKTAEATLSIFVKFYIIFLRQAYLVLFIAEQD